MHLFLQFYLFIMRTQVHVQNTASLLCIRFKHMIKIISDMCSTHLASVAAGALTVFFRFMVDPGPWHEYHLSGQQAIVQHIPAEGKFLKLVVVPSMRMPPPPYSGWSLDFIAYIILLSVIVLITLSAHLCYKRKVKPLYHFSYKKL